MVRVRPNAGAQVLRGEHLQARLQQELRFTGQLGQAMGQGAREPVAYPMHRAEILASDVRRLGLARGSLSYLDFCGVLVSGQPFPIITFCSTCMINVLMLQLHFRISRCPPAYHAALSVMALEFAGKMTSGSFHQQTRSPCLSGAWQLRPMHVHASLTAPGLGIEIGRWFEVASCSERRWGTIQKPL